MPWSEELEDLEHDHGHQGEEQPYEVELPDLEGVQDVEAEEEDSG
jgi:hypothetical protein